MGFFKDKYDDLRWALIITTKALLESVSCGEQYTVVEKIVKDNLDTLGMTVEEFKQTSVEIDNDK